MLRLSQGLLNLLETCPRKFQYSVLEQLTPPPAESQQNSIDWGNRFHLLMQQAQLKLPLNALLGGQAALRQAFEALHQANPQLLAPSPTAHYDSEHLRSFSFGEHSFSVIYDLLISEPDQAQILDWKTYPKPVNAKTLTNDWQTKLYCFGLVETSLYQPEQITMTYWFVRSKDNRNQPESLQIRYSQKQHEKNQQALQQLTQQLNQWLEIYRQGQDLPQIPLAQRKCDRCGFLNRCRGQGSLEAQPFETDLEAIAEVAP
jgi:hypothetical protein